MLNFKLLKIRLMKKIHITLFSVISLLFVTSCDDYLHKDPIGLLTPDNVNSTEVLASNESGIFQY